MFFTQTKFHKLNSLKDLQAKISEFEIQTNFDSPRTQKALIKMNKSHLDFRRKNKFELQNELERRGVSDSEILTEQYEQYLESLLNNYMELKEQRKVIKEWFKKKQQEEDELRGYEYVPIQSAQPSNRQPYSLITLDDKIGKINHERMRQQSFNDAAIKEALLKELDRRQWETIQQSRNEKNAQFRSAKIMEIKKKALDLNKKAKKKFQEHKKNEEQQIVTDLAKTKELQDRLNQKEVEILTKKSNSAMEKIEKNKKLEEKILFRRSLLRQEQSEAQLINVRKDTVNEENRVKSVERQAKDRMDKQQRYEQQLMKVHERSTLSKQIWESDLCNNFGLKMISIEEQKKKNEDLIKKELDKLQKERKDKFKKIQRNLEQVQEREKQWQQELAEKLQNKDQMAKKLKMSKIEEIRQFREQNAQTRKEQMQMIEQRRKIQQSQQDLLLERSVGAQRKLEIQKVEKEKVLSHLLQSKQKLESEGLFQYQRLRMIPQQSSAQLLDQLQELLSEEEFLEVQKQYKMFQKPQTANPVNKL